MTTIQTIMNEIKTKEVSLRDEAIDMLLNNDKSFNQDLTTEEMINLMNDEPAIDNEEIELLVSLICNDDNNDCATFL